MHIPCAFASVEPEDMKVTRLYWSGVIVTLVPDCDIVQRWKRAYMVLLSPWQATSEKCAALYEPCAGRDTQQEHLSHSLVAPIISTARNFERSAVNVTDDGAFVGSVLLE